MRSLVGSFNRLTLVLALALTLVGPARAEEDAPKPTAQLLDAVVKLHTTVPREARTAPYLGTEREGSGVVIDADGLIVTIGYLVTEAMGVEVTGPDGKRVSASVVGFDNESGLGLVRTTQPLGVRPLALGKPADLAEKEPVLVASFGGAEAAIGARVVSRRTFAGYWEYLLENAIFTAPPHPNWGGAALIGRDGKLLGIGSLVVHDAAQGDDPMPGNMFVPIDRLKPVLADLLSAGRPQGAARPWLGINAQELKGRIVVTRISPDGPAQKAGIERGAVISSVNGSRVRGLADFYRKLWAAGPAGTEVLLTLQQDGTVRDVTVKTIDRYKYLKLDMTY